MIKKNLKKIIVLGSCMFCLISASLTCHASDDDIGFLFKLRSNYANTYSSSRYRKTKSYDNPWKVNMTYNEEGDGCIATYWLAKYNVDNTRCSGTYDVTQGSGPHYYVAWESAKQSDVVLGAENNNDTFSSYTVSGSWDEETW